LLPRLLRVALRPQRLHPALDDGEELPVEPIAGAFERADRGLDLLQAIPGLFFLAQGDVALGSVEQKPFPVLDLKALAEQLEGGPVLSGLA
jgi:hypothetical protein